MSTTPPSDPWSRPSDRPDEPEQPAPGAASPEPPGAEPNAPGMDPTLGPPPPAYPPAGMPPQVPYGETRPRPTPPPSIRTAVRLMYVGAALSAITFLISLLTQGSVREQALERDPALTESELDTIVAISLGIGIFVGLIAVLLWVWMAEANRRGKSWARIVATVLGGLNIVFTVFGIAVGQSSGLNLVVSLISVLLAATILYFLYRPDSNAYYEAVSGTVR